MVAMLPVCNWQNLMDENLPGGLKFDLDSVLSRLEPGPTFPPLLLVTGHWTVVFDTAIVYGLRDDSHDFKTAFWRCLPWFQNPHQTANLQICSRPSNYMLITKIIMAEAESQK